MGRRDDQASAREKEIDASIKNGIDDDVIRKMVSYRDSSMEMRRQLDELAQEHENLKIKHEEEILVYVRLSDSSNPT